MAEGRSSDRITDEALAARVACGDADAFAALYDRYARAVYVLAVHLLGVQSAEEAVQEVFLRLWQRARQFDPARGVFAAWFMTIARHQVQAEMRRRGQESRMAAATDIEALLAATQDPAAGVEDIVWQSERAAAVRRALRDLPPEQRQALVLAYFGDLSHRTIAETLGWPLGTVKKRISLGMDKLRAALAEPAPDHTEYATAVDGAVSQELASRSRQIR